MLVFFSKNHTVNRLAGLTSALQKSTPSPRQYFSPTQKLQPYSQKLQGLTDYAQNSMDLEFFESMLLYFVTNLRWKPREI